VTALRYTPVDVSPLLIAAAVTAALGAQAPQRPPATSPPVLRIVVIAGEDAVNVIQQQTAVAPVIEVRDRNDQPVGGATVRFAIQGGRATFNGARTLTLTTNAAGQAAATGLTPTGTGALQIGASATFQGQTAAVTITQANVMTAAEAAAAGSAASSGSAGAGANAGAGTAAGGGGGLSATTIGIVGAAVAGGAVGAAQLAGGDEGGTWYSGQYSGQTLDVLSPNGACAITVAHSGTVKIELTVSDSGAVSGHGEVSGTMQVVAGSAGCPTGTALAPIGSSQNHGCCSPNPAVTGSRAAVTFSDSHPGGAGTNWTYTFTGTLNDTDITGTFTLTTTYQNNTPAPTVRPFQIRLTRQ
jgi:hypothetical protein